MSILDQPTAKIVLRYPHIEVKEWLWFNKLIKRTGSPLSYFLQSPRVLIPRTMYFCLWFSVRSKFKVESQTTFEVILLDQPT